MPELPDQPGAVARRPPAAPGGASEVLPCGSSVADLVDQADAGRLEPSDEHQAGCAHCRAALRDAAVSDQALGLLRAASGPVPAGLVDRVLAEVGRRRATSQLIEVGPTAHGQVLLRVAGGVRVRQQVVADIARAAASGLRGVTVARASAAGRAGVPGAVDIALGLLVDGRAPLPQLARSVRRAVRAAVGRAVGSEDVTVELAALDLLEQEGAETRPATPQLLRRSGV